MNRIACVKRLYSVAFNKTHKSAIEKWNLHSSDSGNESQHDASSYKARKKTIKASLRL